MKKQTKQGRTMSANSGFDDSVTEAPFAAGEAEKIKIEPSVRMTKTKPANTLKVRRSQVKSTKPQTKPATRLAGARPSKSAAERVEKTIPLEDLHTLQQIRLEPHEGLLLPDTMFFTATPPLPKEEDDKGINKVSPKLVHEQKLSFDSFANTFYERYWMDHTKIEDLRLDLTIKGEVHLNVLRHAPMGGVAVIASKRLGSAKKKSRNQIKVPPARSSAAQPKGLTGRIWFEMVCTSPEAEFVSAEWATPAAPIHEPKVGIVMCTFNKVEDVLRNIKVFDEAMQECPELAKLTIIDQGTQPVTTDGRFPAIKDRMGDRLRVISQGNLGGSGGFTRGTMETFADPTSTHTLLMDDDVCVDPTVLPLLVSVLKYLKRPTIVGGSMFDLFHPQTMAAHAEYVDFDTLSYEPVTPQNVDMAVQGANDVFLRGDTGTYNGWWMCCIPREAIDTFGLAMPCFVRCDDSEFGTRLTSSDFPLVTFPGVYVHHEPFYAKISAWMVYYEMRNFLIMSQRRRGPLTDGQMKAYLRKFYRYLAVNLFDHAYAMLLAMKHFQKGPDFVFANTEALHKQIVKEIGSYAPGEVKVRKEANPHLHPTNPADSPSKMRFLRTLSWVYLRGRGPQRAPRVSEVGELPHFNPEFTYKRDELIIHNPFTEKTISLRPNPKLARKITVDLLKTLSQVRKERDEINNRYLKALDKVTKLEAWEKYLAPQGYKSDQ